jgi:hypothetical protein
MWGQSKGTMIPSNVVAKIYYRDPIKVALRMKEDEISERREEDDNDKPAL